MERDTIALWQPPQERRPNRRDSFSLSEEDFRASTGLDRVPRIIVRMLTSVGMLLLSAVIVVCIHMYARTLAPGKEYVPPMEGELHRPDPRSLDITLGPPDTDTPVPHKVTQARDGSVEVTESHTSSEAHSTPPTLKNTKAHDMSTVSLRQKAPPTVTRRITAARVTARNLSPLVNTAPPVKQDKWRPLASVNDFPALPTDGAKDDLTCSVVHKSFCSNASVSPTAQFFYDPDEKLCLSATVHQAHVCNRSPNQFASRQDCEAACVKSESAPEPRCSERPRFVACAAADVRDPWWFHDGHKCAPWSFTAGRCPVASAPVFSTAVECSAQCGDVEHRRLRGCLFPDSQTCTPRQLRRPFFAVPKGEDSGAFECHKVEPLLLVRHRCLLGPNGFTSWEECDEACHQRTRRR
ncbi:uncharacterized protein LOC125943568 [Dermacentor silvarum]|uniref:uncharacterized protein LOC125943568 n=1 Tax=Dermacentor silvarum TaxID=543639 RepID=UPI002101137D|nr:uncharacterized protein LOC125943568 [Dermacentor silvarum]